MQKLASSIKYTPFRSLPKGSASLTNNQSHPQHVQSPAHSSRTLNPTIHTHSRRSIMASASNASTAAPSGNQLLIVGPGVLGSYLGKLWVDTHGADTAIGQTNTTNNHTKLQSLGITPRTRDAASTSSKFPYVAFCAPPSGSEDYVADIKAALDLWDGTGSFVFTSSAGVYAVKEGECTETSPLVPLGNERTDRLLNAEQAVLDAGGCVVRLVGLYHKTRGAHTFFLKQGEVARWGGALVNLIHYEDAAGLTYAILTGSSSSDSGYRGKVFLGCDDEAISFQDMMDVIKESGVLPGSVTFTGAATPPAGKTTNNSVTREQLQWQPKYKSLREFFKKGGEDFYSSNESVPTGAGHV